MRVTECVNKDSRRHLFFWHLSGDVQEPSNQQQQYGLLSRMHQFGSSMLAFEILVYQGGQSCLSMCVTQQTQAQEPAFTYLIASTHKDLCKSTCAHAYTVSLERADRPMILMRKNRQAS